MFRSTCLMLALLPASVHAADTWPGNQWSAATPQQLDMSADSLARAQDYALTGGGAGMVIHQGARVLSWGDVDRRYDLKSTTKSIGVMALGLALADDKVRLEDKAAKHHASFGSHPRPSAEQTQWLEAITLKQLATQTAGFEKAGGYTSLQFSPGSRWSYSDGGPNWLAECLTLSYQRDMADLLAARIFRPLGIQPADLTWRKHAYRDHKIDGIVRREFGSGISANVDAMARIGYLFLREGRWGKAQLLPRSFVAQCASPQATGLPVIHAKRYGKASDHYGLLWWNNADGALPKVPRDAFWSWGLYDSLIVVIPSLDLVAARAGRNWKREPSEDWRGHYEVLQPFLQPLAAAVMAPKHSAATQLKENGRAVTDARHPRSRHITGIQWAPTDTIIRMAKGSDNWPITWGDDGALYTAYGDGWGFKPKLKQKLSLGLCRITGMPPTIRGVNLRSATAERTGQGARGPKASSLLMVDGVLYMFVRNTGNATLAWSKDRGQTWTWETWRLRESFGYPVFLNFGMNYSEARDGFVYIYSHDHDSAYQRADRMVLARVPKEKLRFPDAYEYFVRREGDGAVWSRDIQMRGAAFSDHGRCYRCSVSFHPPTGRYLWCQTGLGEDTRFHGGFAIYDAPEPWGPWTTVYATDAWDVGPGETCCLPTAWMSADGNSVHLVFSGDDCFSVRHGRLQRPSP